MPEYLKKEEGGVNWDKFFMSIAVAVVFVFQGYSQVTQNNHSEQIEKIEKETLTETQIDEKMQEKLLYVEKQILEAEKKAFERQERYYDKVLLILLGHADENK